MQRKTLSGKKQKKTKKKESVLSLKRHLELKKKCFQFYFFNVHMCECEHHVDVREDLGTELKVVRLARQAPSGVEPFHWFRLGLLNHAEM